MFINSLCEDIIGKFAFLLEAVDAFVKFKVNPDMMFKGSDVIFVDELLWDDCDLDMNVFRVVKGRADLEVQDVKELEFGTLCGEDAAEEQSD